MKKVFVPRSLLSAEMVNQCELAAIVVHHKSYSTVGSVVDDLLREGISADRIVLLDNSEEPGRRPELRSTIPDGVHVVFESNKGYAAAVNRAVEVLAGLDLPGLAAVVVATHEVRVPPGTVMRLTEQLEDAGVGVVGPTLITGEDQRTVWSTGGYFSRWSGTPRHFSHNSDIGDLRRDLKGSRERDWLDGAFLVYRWKMLLEHPLNENFFLYFEEVDYHRRIKRLGFRVVCVLDVTVWQSSGGVPMFYYARNLRLFHRSASDRFRERVIAPLMVWKRVLGSTRKGFDAALIRSALAGLTVSLPDPESQSGSPKVRILNPLGAALQRFEEEIGDVLRCQGLEVEVSRLYEPSTGKSTRAAWVAAYLKLLLLSRRSAQKPSDSVLVLWPVLGYLDLILLRVVKGNASVIIHDPEPLVRAIGYGRLASWLASPAARSKDVIVLSEVAAVAVRNRLEKVDPVVLPHPILSPRRRASGDLGGLPQIRVFGQYKQDRDLVALRYLGEQLRDEAVLQIYGRGWPAVEGWDVNAVFLPEDQLDDLMAGSSAVLIPYRRFFQSGIAIRCLEVGVPFVGPRESVLAELAGQTSDYLVAEGSLSAWLDAVRAAVAARPEEVNSRALTWRSHAEDMWLVWAKQM